MRSALFVLLLFGVFKLYSVTWPEGNRWTQEYLCSKGASQSVSRTVSVKINKSGFAIAAWGTYENEASSGNIYISERNSKGVWSTPIQVNSQISNQGSHDLARNPRVSLNDQGEAVVTWYTNDTNNENIYVSTRSANGTWSAEQQVNSKTGGSSNISWFPEVAMNANGEAVVTWYTSITNNQNIYASTRSASGAWSVEQQINSKTGGSSNIATAPQVTMSNSGEAVVTWDTSDINNYNIYVSIKSASGTWSVEQQINASTGGSSDSGFAPQVTMNNSGEAIVTWGTNEANNLNIYVSTRSVSEKWSTEQQINSKTGGSSDKAFNPKVAMNEAGEAVVTWYAIEANFAGNIYVSTRSASGEWSAEEQINASTGGSSHLATVPQVAMNNSGEAVVTWPTHSSNGNIYVSTRSVSGKWSAEQQINNKTGGSSSISWLSQVALNSSGEAVVSWETSETNNQNTYVSSFYNLSEASQSNVRGYSKVNNSNDNTCFKTKVKFQS